MSTSTKGAPAAPTPSDDADPCALDCNYRAEPGSRFCTQHAGTDVTPEGLLVVERDDDEESITVEWYDGTLVKVYNVADETDERDRYAVDVAGVRYTDQLRAPIFNLATDVLGSAADDACSFANNDGLLCS